MKLLEQKILTEGKVKPGDILKVDGFLNHRIDMELCDKLADELVRLFDGCGANKVLTIEASGIALACLVAQKLRVPLVFAKKVRTKNIADDVYRAKVLSYTTGNVYEIVASKDYVGPDDRMLIIDDFLARGEAVSGLLDLAEQANAEVVGIGIAIEKGFQPGGKQLREKGYHLESLAILESMSDDGAIVFRDQPHQS